MEIKELKIQIPDGYCIDESKSTFEKIVFKKKDNSPKSWEEYCKLQKENFNYGYIIDDADARIDKVEWKLLNTQDTSSWRNVLPSEKLAEAFLAMMQLMSLRQAWIGDWEPDWKDFRENKWGIINHANKCAISIYGNSSRALSFPTEEMATDFMNCFKDLLEIAKPLI